MSEKKYFYISLKSMFNPKEEPEILDLKLVHCVNPRKTSAYKKMLMSVNSSNQYVTVREAGS